MATLFIISAPSGAGKTTLVNALVARLNPPYRIERAITFTTKTARNIEKDGKDYHFISTQEFEKRIQKDFFLEYSTAYGTYYGVPQSLEDGLRDGISYFLIIDRNGAQALANKIASIVTIWISTPTINDLRDRLYKRGTETEVAIEKRLLIAQQEIEQEIESPFYRHHIINDTFEVAISSLMDIVVPILKMSDKQL